MNISRQQNIFIIIFQIQKKELYILSIYEIDLNKKAKQHKIHYSVDHYNNFLENITLDKKRSQIRMNLSTIQNTLKSYLLVRLSNMQKVKQKTSSQSKHKIYQENTQNKSPLPIDDQQRSLQQLGINIKYPFAADSQQINTKVGSDIFPSQNIQNKQPYEDNRKMFANLKKIFQKYIDPKKLNPPSRISQQYQSTRPTKISDPKAISMIDNQICTFNQISMNLDQKQNNQKQEVKESDDFTDVLFCQYVVNDQLIKKYKISISEIYIDQPLLVMSFEDNNEESQRYLKKQNDNLQEILIRSHLGYIQKQQNEQYCLHEMNYKELKFNQYLHMNSVFAMTQHVFLNKRNKLPLKHNEFNINSLIENIKQIFPQLNIIKDQSLHDQTKGQIKNDQMKIKYIITSILSHIFYQQNLQRQNIETPHKLMSSSALSYCNIIYYFDTECVQYLLNLVIVNHQQTFLKYQNSNIKIKNNNGYTIQFLSPLPQNSGRNMIELHPVCNKGNTNCDDQINLNPQFTLREPISQTNIELNSTNKIFQDQQNVDNPDEQLRNKQKQQLQEPVSNKNNKNINENQLLLNGIWNDSIDQINITTQNKELRKHRESNFQLDQSGMNSPYNLPYRKSPILKSNQENDCSLFDISKQQSEIYDIYDHDDVKNDEKQSRQQVEDLGQSFEKVSKLNHLLYSPTISIKLVEKQKDYQKDCYEIKISYLPSQNPAINSSPQQAKQDKKLKQTYRGISATINTMMGVGNVSEFNQQTKSLTTITNNSMIELDIGRKIYDLDQNSIPDLGGQMDQNKYSCNDLSSQTQYFSNLNGNQDSLINKIEERVLLECIKQVCTCQMQYNIEKTGIHVITFCILSELPNNQMPQIIKDKKKAESNLNLYISGNPYIGKSSSVLNLSSSNLIQFKEKNKKKMNSQSLINISNLQSNQQYNQSSPYLNSKPNSSQNYLQANHQPQNSFKNFNFKQQPTQLKNLNVVKSQSNTIFNQPATPTLQLSPSSIQRKRQTSLPTVNEKTQRSNDVKEEDMAENYNSSTAKFKQKQKKLSNHKNSNSLTNIEKSPLKKTQLLQQDVAIDKSQQKKTCNTISNDRVISSPRRIPKPVKSKGSQLPRNQYRVNQHKSGNNFQDFLQAQIQLEDDNQNFNIQSQLSQISQHSMQVESERKAYGFVIPHTLISNMQKRNHLQDNLQNI